MCRSRYRVCWNFSGTRRLIWSSNVGAAGIVLTLSDKLVVATGTFPAVQKFAAGNLHKSITAP